MADTFEYKIIVSDADDESDEETLNSWGAEGWDLISAVADVRASDDAENEDENVPVTVFYLKRSRS